MPNGLNLLRVRVRVRNRFRVMVDVSQLQVVMKQQYNEPRKQTSNKLDNNFEKNK